MYLKKLGCILAYCALFILWLFGFTFVGNFRHSLLWETRDGIVNQSEAEFLCTVRFNSENTGFYIDDSSVADMTKDTWKVSLSSSKRTKHNKYQQQARCIVNKKYSRPQHDTSPENIIEFTMTPPVKK